MAVQVAPTVKPVIVVLNGVPSDAEPLAGVGVPLVQLTVTDIEAPLFGTKSLLTVSVALFRLFVIVQFPTDTRAAEQVPDELYPVGIGDSVAVQVGSPLEPSTFVTNGVASEADPEAGTGVPLTQLTLTLTEAPLLGMKSLLTVNVWSSRMLVIVQDEEPPTVISTSRQPVWMAE